MGYNIGPKIGIDGEAQFRQQIKAINNEYKTLQAQTKALTAEYDKNNDQQGKLKVQAEQLEKQIDAQKYAIFKMKGALEEAERTTGANSDAVTTWRGKLYNAQATVAELEKELQDTEDALQKMERGIEDTGDAAEDAGEDVADFGDILKGNLAADAIWDAVKEGAELLAELGKEALSAASELKAEGAQFEQTFGEMEQAAIQALQALEKNTGISSTRIKGNFSTVYAFAKTMGAESADALDIASRAMAAAADSAAYYDKTVEEVTETIQAYIKGNYANDAALGIASTEVTRNAAALERYGKAFKELSESQKVDTLLAMVEAGNKASGAMGQAAREAGEWTNVTGELEDAQKQLLAVIGEPILEAAIPIVQELTENIRELAEATPGEELREEIEGFAEAWNNAETAYSDSMASIAGTATVAERYLRQLQELEKQGLNTTEAHAAYENIVAQLQAVMPELNLTISEQTGLLEQNTGALLADVEAWKDLASQQAIYDKMQGQLEAYGKAQLAVAEAEEKRTQATTQEKQDLETLNNLLNITGAAYVKLNEKRGEGQRLNGMDMYRIYDQQGKLLATVADHMWKADTTAEKYAKSAYKAGQNVAELNAEIAEGNRVISDYETEVDRLTSLMEGNTEGTEENAEAQQKQAQAVAETQAALLELETAYQEAEKSTRAMLDSSIGLWDEMAKESEWTAKKVLENWRGQMKAFNSYAANLEKAKDMGLADGIIEALSDGSQQSMQILDAMVNQSQYSVGEINAAFTDLDLAKDGTTNALMSLDTSLQEGYDKLVEDAREAGVEIVDGIVQAIRDNAYKVENALDGLGRAEEDAEMLGQMQSPMDKWQKWQDTKQAGMATMIQNEFNITQLPGESAEEFAERVAEIIKDDYEQKRGGLGG